MKRIKVPAGWTVEQMAVEPLTEDPVNFSFGADGTLWVAEMGDYPYGDKSKGKIRRLRDKDGDGVNKYTIFGQVISGMEVIDSIVHQPRDKNDAPLTPIPMKVEIKKVTKGWLKRHGV